MKKLVVLLVICGCAFGCTQGMIRAEAIKPSVDIVTKALKDRTTTSEEDLRSLCDELKATVDKAVGK